MHLSGIIVGSVTLHIVSLFCACVSNTIARYSTVDFHISRSLVHAYRDVWGKSYRQAGRCLCLNIQILATLVVNIKTLES